VLMELREPRDLRVRLEQTESLELLVQPAHREIKAHLE